MPHIDPKYDEMTWFHPPSKIAPQPNNLTETFEATCRLLMIARRIMDVMWVHGVDPSFSPLTRIFWLLAMGGTRLAVAHWILITWSMTLSMPFLLTTTYVVNLRTSTRLNMWKKSLSEDLEITPRSRLTATPHKLMLHLAYWWLVILLHRPFFRRKSRPIHSADSEIDHVKVSSIFLILRETYTTFLALDMSTSCRTDYGVAIYMAHSLQTPLLPNHPHPNRLHCWYCVPSDSYASSLRISDSSERTSTFLGPGNAGAARPTRNRSFLELCHSHFNHP